MNTTPRAGSAVGIHAELVAVVIGVEDARPRVLAAGRPPHLPAGPLREDHQSLQEGVRAFAAEQTGHTLGYVEQLYTFADLDRGGPTRGADADADSTDPHRTISISYLGLTRTSDCGSAWMSIYDLLPWEDRRHVVDEGDPDRVIQEIETALARWCADDDTRRQEREDRCSYVFGRSEQPWRPELALQRYELLWEAGLVGESGSRSPLSALTGPAMLHDHRRILATGLSRLRSALQYRPVVFELMPDTFTLGQLQEAVESLAGQLLHKQNFRRLVEQQHELVEPTGATTRATGGRPARLYRFRRDVFAERAQVGTKLPLPRSR